MIPYSYSMVDMGGIDLAEANGTVVDGLYNRLALARNACGDLILYNWKFVGIEIAPSACSTLDEGSSIVINGSIEVTDEDVVTVTSLLPPEPVIEQLTVTENRIYFAPEGVDGYSPVDVNVPSSNEKIRPASILVSSNVLAEYDCLSLFPSASDLVLGDTTATPGLHMCPTTASKITYDLGEPNHSVTAYVVGKMLSGGGNYQIIGAAYDFSSGNSPNIFSNGSTFFCSVYGGDFSTGLPYDKFAVLSISIDSSARKIKYYANGQYKGENSLNNSGRYVSFGGGVNNSGVVGYNNSCSLLYIGVVDGAEDSQAILDNHLLIMEAYSDYIGA